MVVTSIFTIEVIIKVIAKGFIVNGPGSYMRSSANVIDIVIVIFSLLSLIF